MHQSLTPMIPLPYISPTLTLCQRAAGGTLLLILCHHSRSEYGILCNWNGGTCITWDLRHITLCFAPGYSPGASTLPERISHPAMCEHLHVFMPTAHAAHLQHIVCELGNGKALYSRTNLCTNTDWIFDADIVRETNAIMSEHVYMRNINCEYDAICVCVHVWVCVCGLNWAIQWNARKYYRCLLLECIQPQWAVEPLSAYVCELHAHILVHHYANSASNQ